MSLVKANGAGEVSTGLYNGVIDQSLRFEDGSSTYLYNVIDSTPSSTTQTTFSFWVKRANLTSSMIIYCNYTSAPNVAGYIQFNSSDKLLIYVDKTAAGSDETSWTSSQVFRDTTNWYHILVQYDVGQASNDNKVKAYVNGSQITLTASQTGSAVTAHRLLDSGIRERWGNYFNSSLDYDGYLAEVNVIDGQVVSQNSFGETKNGVWIAKKYTGSYGNNGYRLQFKETGDGESTASSSTIGADTSDNNHHFQDYNFDGHDSNMPDSPENNFCTINVLDLRFRASLSEGNLDINATTYSGGNYGFGIGTFKIPSSGKWYIEAYGDRLAGSGNISALGIIDRNNIRTSAAAPSYNITTDEGFDGIASSITGGTGTYYFSVSDGVEQYRDTSLSSTSFIHALAIDVDNGYIYIGRRDGTDGTGSEITWRDFADGSTGSSNVDPTSGSSGTGGIARTFGNNDVLILDVSVNGSNTNKSRQILNAGQDSSFAGKVTAQNETDGNGQGDFYYSVPSGYLALCSANLPDIAIGPNSDTQADDHFDTILRDGHGSSGGSTSANFKADWIWEKPRNQAHSHYLIDSSRGIVDGSTQALLTNTTNAELTANWYKPPTSSSLEFNTNDWSSSFTLVDWIWKANGGTTSSNGSGSITSTVQANTTAGFSIVLYTGTESNATVGHGLGKKPEMIIWKKRSGANDWIVYHGANTSEPATDHLHLNTTAATSDPSGSTFFQDTEPTTTVFSIGTDHDVNQSGQTYVAYVFAEIEGYSKFGSYTGNNSTDGTFVYTGFRPAWIMIKATAQTESWGIHDNKRNTSNVVDDQLLANVANAENAVGTARQQLDFLSNGFKLRNAGDANPSINNESTTYIYMAFAEQPFKFSNAR